MAGFRQPNRQSNRQKHSSFGRPKSLYTLLAWYAAVLLQPVSAQESACQRWGGSAAVSNGKFFYSGGWYRSKKANGAATVSKTLFEFDLSKWGWDDVDVSEYVSVPELYSDKETQPTPVLVSSNNTIYSVFAPSEDISGYSILSTASQPKAASLNIKPSNFKGLKNLVHTQSATSATAYAIGEGKDGVVLASFDMESSTVTTIKPAMVQPDLPTKGVLQYIPVGDQGALVYFGGKIDNVQAATDEIQVFDFSDSIWREQQTTGNDPSNSGGDIYCSAFAEAEDGSSYLIYNFKNDGNVFILSLPSFVWFQIPPESDSASDYEPPRESYNTMASCAVAPGSRQVVFFGIGSEDNDSCDKGKGVYVYDLDDLAWKNSFDKSIVGFEVPSQVSRIIGGDASGGANMLEPERGWSTTGLRRLFLKAGQNNSNGGADNNTGGKQDGGTTVPGTNVNSGTTSPDAADSGGAGKGAIIGGPIVGVIVIGALIAGYLYMKRRRSQRGQSTMLRSITSPPMPPNHQPQHTENHFEFDKKYNQQSRQNSISKFGSDRDFSAESLSTRWSPDPFKSPHGLDSKKAFSPVSSISRRLTDNSSTLYTPSALLAEVPDTPYSEQFPRSPTNARFNGHSPDRSDFTDMDSIGYVFELPAHIPAKAYTNSNRGSKRMQFNELEGDYAHPIEKGDSDIPDAVPVIGKKSIKSQRSSQELLLDRDVPGVMRPESAVLPATVRSALGYSSSIRVKPGMTRSATDSPSGIVKTRPERSGSVQDLHSAQAESNPETKAWTGRAKLVELKRGPSLKKKEGLNSPTSPTSEGGGGAHDSMRQLRDVTE